MDQYDAHTPCNVPECDRPGVAGMCWGHRKQYQRTGKTSPLRARDQSPRAVVLEAVYHLADVDPMEGDAFERAFHRLRMAVRRMSRRKPRQNAVQVEPETLPQG